MAEDHPPTSQVLSIRHVGINNCRKKRNTILEKPPMLHVDTKFHDNPFSHSRVYYMAETDITTKPRRLVFNALSQPKETEV
jgi:hypothetical protein